MKISICRPTKNEYDYEWFKKNVDNKNIDVKYILMYSKNFWVENKAYEAIYEDDVYSFISDGNQTYLIKKQGEINKGDKVKVIDKECTYMWYDEWFKKYDIDATYWCYGVEPKENETYTLVDIRQHLTIKNWMVCLIEDLEGRMFLIKTEGIKRV